MDWQTCLALAIVALAVGVLTRHVLRVVRGSAQSGCGSCPSRNVTNPIKSLPLVQISTRKESNA
jgi:hypothetical protein